MLFEEFQTSALDFYTAVEEAVKRREAPDLEFSHVEWNEKGVLSAKRTYLRVKRGRLNFDICAAPYGRGHFFSWWLAETPSFAALGYFLLLIGALGIGSILIMAIFGGGLDGGCAALFLIFLLWIGGIPLGLFLLGRAVAEGAFGDESAVLATPVLGPLNELVFNPFSYYRLDTAAMFQETVRRSVMEVVNELRETQGLRALTEAEQAPSMQRFLKDLGS
jgi:hypothetical protein